MGDFLDELIRGEEAASRDGTVKVAVRPDGVFLTVRAPQGQGRPVSLAQAERALAQKEIVDVDLGAVRAALEAKTGEPVRVAPRRPDLDRPAEVTVELSQDQMEAYLTVRPPLGGRRLTVEDVRQALAAAGVVEGVKTDAIDAAVAGQDVGGKALVAAGRAPVNGNDAYIDYRFSVQGPTRKPLELENGSVDYYNLQTVQNVTSGQVLAVRVPPTNGIAGATVTGRPLPPKPGRDVRLPKGKNTDASPTNPDELVAVVGGQVMLQGGNVSVLPVYEVRGDVDFGTGNIDFQGSVVVRGSVSSGFTIKATGNVEVRGSVEASTILAEGDVIVHRGVQGGDRGLLVGNNVQAKFIQNCRVEAAGDVVVDDALMYADVEAQGKVEARGSKGRIVGGVVRAVREVSARVLGSKLGTPTQIWVGVNPEIRAELDRVSQELAVRERQLDEVVKSIRVIKEAISLGKPVPGGDERLAKLAQAMTQLKQIVEDMQARKEELKLVVSNAGTGLVRAHDTVFPGVRISIGPLSLTVQDEASKALFYIEDGDIRMGSA